MADKDVSIRLKLQAPTGMAPGLKEAAGHADKLDKSIQAANAGLKLQKTIAQDAALAIHHAERQRAVNQLVNKHYAAMGRDPHGDPFLTPQQRAAERVRATIEGRAVNDAYAQQLKAQGLDANGRALPNGLQRGALMAGRFGMGAAGIAGAAVAGVYATSALATHAFDVAGGMAAANAQPHPMSRERQWQAQWEAFSINGPVLAARRRWKEAKDLAPVVAKLHWDSDPKMAALEAKSAMAGPMAAARFERDMALEEERAVKEIPGARMPVIDRSTAAGMLQYERERSLLGPRQAIVEGERGVLAMRRVEKETAAQESLARHNLAADQKKRDEIIGNLERLQRQEGDETKNAHDGGERGWKRWFPSLAGQNKVVDSQVRLAGPLQALKEQDEKIRGSTSRLNQEEENHKRAQVELGAKNLQLAQGKLGYMKQQLGVLEQQEQISRGSAGRLGGMNAGERMMGLQALKFEQKYGIGRMTPEMIASEFAFAPLHTQKALEKFGPNTPEFQEAKRMGIADFTQGGVKDLQGRQDEKLKEIAELTDKSAVMHAESIANSFVSAFDKALDIMDKKIKEAMDKIRTQQWQARGMGN